MSSPLVSLAWDGHHRTLVTVLEKLLVNSHFVDCTIAAEGQKLKAHREILSAFSPFFELLFSEETENNPTVIISGISFGDLKSLVNFMYRGELEVTEDRIQDLIDAAECLQIEGLGGGNKEDVSRNLKNRHEVSSGIPHKQAGKCENEETANVCSMESEMNCLNYSDARELENSVAITCGARQFSPVHNLIPNFNVQNVSIVSNISLIPVQSETEMDNLNLRGEYVVKEESDSDGDENINEPKNDTSRIMHVYGNSRISYENSGEETIVGLSADINEPSAETVCVDLPTYCVSPTVLSSQLRSRDLTVSSVKNELCNINVKSCSESVEPVEPEETQVTLLHSEFHIKTEDETLLFMNNALISENDELSENLPESIGGAPVTDMHMEMVCTERRNDCPGTVSGCTSESTYPRKLRTACVKIQRIDETAVGLMTGLPAEVSPHVTPTPPSHTTPACDEDLPGITGTDVRSGSSADMYRCQMCNTTFTHRGSLNVHMRIHAKDKLFRYDGSNNAAVTSNMLNEYLNNESRRKLYKCTSYDFKSVKQRALRVHTIIHKGLESNTSREFDYSCSQSGNQERYEQIHIRDKPYKCTECDYRATRIWTLKVHQRIHSGVKPYKCSKCDYRATQISTLRRHQRNHSGVKPHKCTECDYRTSEHSSLKKHQRIHSGVKPYECSKCDYRATQICTLRRHQLNHSGVKPHKCTECDYRTSEHSNLKKHQRIHSGVKPYKCT